MLHNLSIYSALIDYDIVVIVHPGNILTGAVKSIGLGASPRPRAGQRADIKLDPHIGKRCLSPYQMGLSLPKRFGMIRIVYCRHELYASG